MLKVNVQRKNVQSHRLSWVRQECHCTPSVPLRNVLDTGIIRIVPNLSKARIWVVEKHVKVTWCGTVYWPLLQQGSVYKSHITYNSCTVRYKQISLPAFSERLQETIMRWEWKMHRTVLHWTVRRWHENWREIRARNVLFSRWVLGLWKREVYIPCKLWSGSNSHAATIRWPCAHSHRPTCLDVISERDCQNAC